MRLVLTTFLFIILISGNVLAADDSVRFVIQDVTPKVVQPGYNGPLEILIKNVGFEPGYRINGELVTISSPINIVGNTKQFLDLRTQPCGDLRICNLLSAGDLATFTFGLSIPDNADTGVYYSTLQVSWLSGTTTKTASLNFGLEVVGAPNLVISGTSSSPSIIYPDTEFSLPITIENIGTDKAKSVELKLTLGEGFSGDKSALLGTIEKTEAIQQVLTSLNKTIPSPYTATFNLKAEEGISLGQHIIQTQLSYKDSKGKEYSKSTPVELFIHDRGEAKLAISQINSSPSKIYPNTDITLTLTFENTGAQAAKATKLVLNIPKEFTGEDSAFLGTIQKSGSSSASFNLKALKASKPGTYAVKAITTYADEQGRDRESQHNFNLFILDRGEVVLEISGKSTSPAKLVPGTDFTLSLQMENIGDQDAKSVRIELEPDGDILGEFTSFVGEIEQDDVSTGVFDLSILPTAQSGARMMTARVIYTDEAGTEKTVLKSFDLFVGEKSGGPGLSAIAGVIIVLIVAVYLYRRRKSESAEA